MSDPSFAEFVLYGLEPYFVALAGSVFGMKRKRKRIWMTNVFPGQANGTIAQMERENPEWRGKIVQGDPEPTARLNREKLIKENMVGIYRNE